MSDDPICEACGHPRSNHPYRHPFVGPSRDDTIKQQADRIEELEAKLAKQETLMAAGFAEYERRLAKAVEVALEECPFRLGTPKYDNWWRDRRATIAELTGGKDE